MYREFREERRSGDLSMRSGIMVVAAWAAAVSPAAAQWCACGEAGVATVAAPVVLLPSVRRETVLVPHTRLVRRTVLVSRTVYVPRRRWVERPVAVPALASVGAGYPVGYHYGATYVPPGISYPCLLGTVGCDSSAVGPLDY
jgi:hypothetical protein